MSLRSRDGQSLDHGRLLREPSRQLLTADEGEVGEIETRGDRAAAEHERPRPGDLGPEHGGPGENRLKGFARIGVPSSRNRRYAPLGSKT